jgi:hypothetical protein
MNLLWASKEKWPAEMAWLAIPALGGLKLKTRVPHEGAATCRSTGALQVFHPLDLLFPYVVTRDAGESSAQARVRQ